MPKSFPKSHAIAACVAVGITAATVSAAAFSVPFVLTGQTNWAGTSMYQKYWSNPDQGAFVNPEAGMMYSSSSIANTQNTYYSSSTGFAGEQGGGAVNVVSSKGGGVVVTSGAKPDLSVTKSAPETVAWDAQYMVTYTVTNRGAKTTQANLVEASSTGAFDEKARIYVSNPIAYNGMRSGEGVAPNRVSCGRVAANVRCIFPRGIDAGETLQFTVIYDVHPRPVQCDAVAITSPATILPGMNTSPTAAQMSLRLDANPADNVSGGTAVRVTCDSITADMAVQIDGPNTITKGQESTFVIRLQNTSQRIANTVPVQITVPDVGYDFLGVQAGEKNGMCSRGRNDSLNQVTCMNPSVRLSPGGQSTFTVRLRAKDQCQGNQVSAAIAKSLLRPDPRIGETYDVNTSNNSTNLAITCQ